MAPPPTSLDARLRQMRPDDYVEWLLEHGHYRVDAAAAVVVNRRRNQRLSPARNRHGQLVVCLTYGAVARKVPLCRVVAVARWGAAACLGKSVVPEDGNPDNARVANLRLSDVEHHPRGGRKPKDQWEPCANPACADPGGYVAKQGKTPTRIDGRRFGIVGKICHKCYGYFYHRDRVRNRAAGEADEDDAGR